WDWTSADGEPASYGPLDVGRGPGDGTDVASATSFPPNPSSDPCSPTISVIVPVFRPRIWFLRRCVESVREQVYGKWELCLCDDASGSTEVSEYLNDVAAGDPRIKVAVHETNGGISRASNTALAMANGEFVALLDHDDELTPDALLAVARRVLKEPEADII